jgi:hypothetical protein
VSPSHRMGRMRLLVALAALSVGCSDDPSGTSLQKGFTLTPGVATVSLTPGGTKTTFVKAARVPGFGGQVTFGIGNVSTPLNVSMATTSTADSIRLDITASATAAGNYSFDVFGAAPGATSERLTVPVTVAP